MARALHIEEVGGVIMKTIREILTERAHREVYALVPDQSVLSAAQFMRSKNIGAVAVTRNGELVGIVSERDMMSKCLSPGLDPRDLFVEQIMSQPLTTASPDDTWEECLNKMKTSHFRHLPVVESGRLIGMISLRDLLGFDEAEKLDTYLWDRFARKDELVY